MKSINILVLALSLLLCGCNFDTAPIDRFRIVDTKEGLVIRLDTETGQVALVTKSGLEQLKDIKDLKLSPGAKVDLDKHLDPSPDQASTPESTVTNLRPGESTTEGLPPGWTVKRTK
jgi:hypothetical protein